MNNELDKRNKEVKEERRRKQYGSIYELKKGREERKKHNCVNIKIRNLEQKVNKHFSRHERERRKEKMQQ